MVRRTGALTDALDPFLMTLSFMPEIDIPVPEFIYSLQDTEFQNRLSMINIIERSARRSTVSSLPFAQSPK